MSEPVITMLTDYGLDDAFVGVCHGVIARICPAARIIDITHGVPRHDVRTGALLLADAIRYMPPGVHVGIVDPDVGAARRAIALATGDGRLFVGPDNGLLWPAANDCGGAVEAAEISHSPLRLEPVSATFHGRDIFAPVAAHLAGGHPLADAGVPLDPAELVTLTLAGATVKDGTIAAPVTLIDRFGNVQLAVGHDEIGQLGAGIGDQLTLQSRGGETHAARFVRSFAEAAPDELIVFEDAMRRLAIAVRNGSAADRLGLEPGHPVTIR